MKLAPADHPEERGSSQNTSLNGAWNVPSLAPQFADLLKETSGVDLNVCYQCRKCYSGCPVAFAMDRTPVQLIHAARLGLKDYVLGSTTIWLCAACETCVTRCPQEIDLVKLMDAMKRIALRSRVRIADPEVAGFYRASLLNIRLFGRMYEIGLIGQLKLATLNFARDLGLGLEMLKKRKLTLLPDLKFVGRANHLFAQAQRLERRK
jgi:heterodisulfide reductase subunit C